MFIVEVIYASLKQQNLIRVEAEPYFCIEDVIHKSGLLLEFPEIDLAKNKVGIYNQIKPLEELVKVNDRIEIYRPLITDPKDVRRKRAEKQKKDGVI